MKTVTISDFQKNLLEYLKISTPLVITQHGKTVALWLPVPRRKTEAEWAEFDRAAARVDEFVAELDGMTEEEIVEDFKRWRTGHKRPTEEEKTALL
jgi:antitoxin (DNA-binding transcriptional repressor) of toxin-antitoxin stability system